MTRLKESRDKEIKNAGKSNSVRWETGTLYSKMGKRKKRDDKDQLIGFI